MKISVPVLALLGACAVPSIASAHMGSTKDVRIEVADDTVEAQVELDAVDVSVALGLGLEPGPDVLDRHAALVSAWLGQGLVVTADGQPCPARVGSPAFGLGDDVQRIFAPITFSCPEHEAIALYDATVFDEDSEHRTFVTVVAGSTQTTHVLRAGSRSVELSPRLRPTDTAVSFLEEGAVHLVTGYDHLLFLLSLLLIAGLTVQRRGFRPAVADVAWVVTAFTVGHSVSLGAAALGFVQLPSQWVEVAIAGSIVLVAMLNVLRPETPTAETIKARALIAATFGLIHGFGFSSVLADVGLPADQRVLALLSFNVGIELAQLSLVALLMLPLSLASRRASYRRIVLQGGSLAIAAMGCVWVVERTLGG